MDDKEKKLVEGLVAGDDSAYEELFRVHFPYLKDLACSMVHDEFAAKTIVSDFFYHIWEIRSSLRVENSLRAYLARGVYNRCLNHLRSARNEPGRRLPLTPDADRDSGEDPLGDLMARELEQRMEEAVASLPEATRRVFLMHRSDGLKYEEITTATGISVNTVKYHIKRALAILRKRFGKDSPPLP